MADKRIEDLSTGTLDVADKIIIDKSGNSEAEEVTIAALTTYLDSVDIFTDTFVVGDTDGTPNWDINFNHSLNTAYGNATFWDGSGNQKTANGIASVVDVDNTKGRLHHAITGTWKVKITKS